MSKGRKSEYPLRPDKKGRPKSTHKASKKSRTWFEGGTYKFPVDDKLCSVCRVDQCQSSLDGVAAFIRNLNPGFRGYVHDWGTKGRQMLPLPMPNSMK